MGYTRQAIVGISWTWVLRLLTRAVAFLKIAVIARVLTPTQFGLFGVASLVLALIEVFTETGINILIIQENEKLEKIVDTAWIVSILRGVLIFTIIVLSAPFVVMFFKSPDALKLIYLIALVPLIKGFINPSEIKFQKELTFKKDFYFRGSLFALEALAGIAFVLAFKSPVGIIYGLFLGALAEVIISFILIKPIPVFNFNLSEVKKIISKGKWLMASGVFNYLYHNADTAIVGRVLGTTSLGVYDMAYKISMLPITEIGNTVSNVVFPVYVKISMDVERLRKAFIKTSLAVTILCLPIGILFYIFAKEIVFIVLGPKWALAIPVFKVLAFFSVVRTMVNPAYSLFLSVKKQEYNTYATFVGLAVMLVTIVPLINRYSLIGAGYAVVMGSLASAIACFLCVIKIFKSKTI